MKALFTDAPANLILPEDWEPVKPSSPSVCAGIGSKAKAGPYGCIALGWYNKPADRREMRCAEIGTGDGSDGKLKANVWYELNANGEFMEVN